MPPEFMLVPILGIVFGTSAMVILVYPFVRAWARRMEDRNRSQVPAGVDARLARIESAVDSIAIEVERISENQRFLTKLQTDKPLASGQTPPR